GHHHRPPGVDAAHGRDRRHRGNRERPGARRPDLPGPARDRHTAGVQPGVQRHARRRGPRARARCGVPPARATDDLEGAAMSLRSAPTAGAQIELESLTKRYPGQAEPAVDDISLVIPAGEIVVLVGPSGSGKTTLLKMINRIIEPNSGRIYLDGEDVTRTNADQLRRRMGYVIQQIGLFPHMTVAQNVATVPRLLRWDRRRIEERVDELLTLVGLDPGEYRSRYPKELSGGQRQRVGVARAMSGDPPVMLMDEPFGAIDPITRDRLQNEFLRIQADMRKTVVFVTHDIDEAIKMGDRIAILAHQSRLAQYSS